VERWKRITGNAWRKVVTVLNRGGRFQAYEKGYPKSQWQQSRFLLKLAISMGNLSTCTWKKNRRRETFRHREELARHSYVY
jgi:hypothetical protein